MDGRCTFPAAITPEAPNARLSHYGDKFGHLVKVVTLTVKRCHILSPNLLGPTFSIY